MLRSGFKLWDLGMGMPYKAAFGAQNAPRLLFLARLRAVRDDASPALPADTVPSASLFPAPPGPAPNPESKRQRKFRARREKRAEARAARAAARTPQQQQQHALKGEAVMDAAAAAQLPATPAEGE